MNIDNVIEKVTKEIRRKYTDCIFNITHETMMGKEYLYIDVQKILINGHLVEKESMLGRTYYKIHLDDKESQLLKRNNIWVPILSDEDSLYKQVLLKFEDLYDDISSQVSYVIKENAEVHKYQRLVDNLCEKLVMFANSKNLKNKINIFWDINSFIDTKTGEHNSPFVITLELTKSNKDVYYPIDVPVTKEVLDKLYSKITDYISRYVK